MEVEDNETRQLTPSPEEEATNHDHVVLELPDNYLAVSSAGLTAGPYKTTTLLSVTEVNNDRAFELQVEGRLTGADFKGLGFSLQEFGAPMKLAELFEKGVVEFGTGERPFLEYTDMDGVEALHQVSRMTMDIDETTQLFEASLTSVDSSREGTSQVVNVTGVLEISCAGGSAGQIGEGGALVQGPPVNDTRIQSAFCREAIEDLSLGFLLPELESTVQPQGAGGPIVDSPNRAVLGD